MRSFEICIFLKKGLLVHPFDYLAISSWNLVSWSNLSFFINIIFFHDRPWKWPGIKLLSNKWDITFKMPASQLSGHIMRCVINCGIINRAWIELMKRGMDMWRLSFYDQLCKIIAWSTTNCLCAHSSVKFFADNFHRCLEMPSRNMGFMYCKYIFVAKGMYIKIGITWQFFCYNSSLVAYDFK